MGKLIDLTGQRFGKLTVVRRETIGEQNTARPKWECDCDCGTAVIAEGANLRSGNTKSCGCGRVDAASKVRPGMRFGSLIVLTRDGSKRYGKVSLSKWHCACDCGKFKSVIGMSLINGDTKSCGCAYKKASALRADAQIEDLSGKTFGFLIVVDRASNAGSGNMKWLCACACGNLTIVAASSLKRGATISCGCKSATGKAYRPDAIRLRANIHTARRRAAVLSAGVSFNTELFELVEIEAYGLARLRTEMTGEEWEVDHIVPLQSQLVCGLHNENNLCVITRKSNNQKLNLIWPDMPNTPTGQ